METKYVIGIGISVVMIALLLPVVLVSLSDVSVVFNGEQVRIPEQDTTILTLFTVLLPILIITGMVLQFMGLKRESSICKSCIWFLRDLTCEKDYELDCKECEGVEF